VPIAVSRAHSLPADHEYFKLFGQAQQRGASVCVPVTLALQGGGSRGIWQAGVLAELLDADVLSIAAVFGASAGAINAAALSVPMTDHTTALREVWSRLASSARDLFPEWRRFPSAIGSLARRYWKGRNRLRRAPLVSNATLEDAIARAFPGAWKAGVNTYVYATELPHAVTKPWDAPPFEFLAPPGATLFRRFNDPKLVPESHPLVKVLAASSCLPIVEPVVTGNASFADGGVLANIPAGFLQIAGALSTWGFTLFVLPTPPERMSPKCDYIDWKTVELLRAIQRCVATRSSRVFVLASNAPVLPGMLGLVSGFKSEESVGALFEGGRRDARPFVAALKDFFSNPVPHTPALQAFDLVDKVLPELPPEPPKAWWMPWVGYEFARQFE
jgi:predicted acylesterase/phospholipase RssA